MAKAVKLELASPVIVLSAHAKSRILTLVRLPYPCTAQSYWNAQVGKCLGRTARGTDRNLKDGFMYVVATIGNSLMFNTKQNSISATSLCELAFYPTWHNAKALRRW